jgi:ribosomal protein S18 acetylase RimI-like enzyme
MSEESERNDSNNQDDNIRIRAAIPDFEEGLLYAQLCNEASEGFFKSILGTKTYEILADAFVKSNNEYSFENTLMIECNGKIAGMVSGYTYEEKQRFRKNILSEFPGGAKLRIMVFSVVGKLLSHFLEPRGQEDYYLQSIAVSSQMRGKGLGQRLLKHSSQIAISKGSKTLSLDVSSKNKNAIKSYKRFGMGTSSVWPNFLKLPPVFTRMSKAL